MGGSQTLARLGPSELDEALLRAHTAGDEAALAALYAEAGSRCDAAGDEDAACFFLTQAYVFAVATGLPEAQPLFEALRARRREAGIYRPT
jgi:hypothetical protein